MLISISYSSLFIMNFETVCKVLYCIVWPLEGWNTRSNGYFLFDSDIKSTLLSRLGSWPIIEIFMFI